MAKRVYKKTGKYSRDALKNRKSYPRLTNKVVTLLKELGLWEDIDRLMVENLIDSLEISDLSLADIKLRGVIVPASENSTFMVKNPSISTYRDSMRLVIEIGKKLGMSSRDRAELGMAKKEVEDDF